MKGLLLLVVFLLLAMLARHLHESSPSFGLERGAALAKLNSVPALSSVALTAESCSYISKSSVTALDCKFEAAIGDSATPSGDATWVFLARRPGEDAWGREVLVESFGQGKWIAELYFQGDYRMVGASLRLKRASDPGG